MYSVVNNKKSLCTEYPVLKIKHYTVKTNEQKRFLGPKTALCVEIFSDSHSKIAD